MVDAEHAEWVAIPGARRPLHPLIPLIDTWERRYSLNASYAALKRVTADPQGFYGAVDYDAILEALSSWKPALLHDDPSDMASLSEIIKARPVEIEPAQPVYLLTTTRRRLEVATHSTAIADADRLDAAYFWLPDNEATQSAVAMRACDNALTLKMRRHLISQMGKFRAAGDKTTEHKIGMALLGMDLGMGAGWERTNAVALVRRLSLLPESPTALPLPEGRSLLARLVTDEWPVPREIPQPGKMTDKEVMIMPRSVAMVNQDAPSYYLPRFSCACHQEPNGQLLMGFATDGERGPTLPAEVWTMGMADAERRGAVIPLPFRMWISPILHVRLSDRHGNHPIALEGLLDNPLTLRRFLSWVYTLHPNPRTGRLKAPARAAYWDRLMDAIDLVNAHETPYERNGHLWLRRVVSVDKPGEYNSDLLDDPWGLAVWLPPGDGTGPRIRFERLQRWWRTRGGDGGCVRALINLAYRWHVEGKRLVPAGGKNRPGRPWLYRRDPEVYDKMTDADKDAICFPAGTGKKRRDLRLAAADAVFEKLIREGDVVWHDGRLIPPQTGLPIVDHWPRSEA